MNKNVIIIVVVLLVVAILGVGAWTMNNRSKMQSNIMETSNPIDATTTIPANEVVTTGNVKEFTVEGSGFKFEPNSMAVKRGDTVRVTFKNIQGMHDFVLDEFDVKTNVINADEEEQVEFVADKAGTFEYYCSVGNHRAQGMVGTLVVE